MNPLILIGAGLALAAYLGDRKKDAPVNDGTEAGKPDAPVSPGESTTTTTADGEVATVTTVDGTAVVDTPAPQGERGESADKMGIVAPPTQAREGRATGAALEAATAANAEGGHVMTAPPAPTRPRPSFGGIVNALHTLTRRDQARMLQEYGPAAGAVW